MAQLAEIKDAVSEAGQQPRTVYINPSSVNFVEPLPGGTRITMNDGKVFQTTVGAAEVVSAINAVML